MQYLTVVCQNVYSKTENSDQWEIAFSWNRPRVELQNQHQQHHNHCLGNLYDHSHPQDKQLRDGCMKCGCALHHSRVCMMCWVVYWVVWSWFRMHGLKVLMVGLTQQCWDIRSQFRLLQCHLSYVPCVCSRFPSQTFYDDAPTLPDDARTTPAWWVYFAMQGK